MKEGGVLRNVTGADKKKFHIFGEIFVSLLNIRALKSLLQSMQKLETSVGGVKMKTFSWLLTVGNNCLLLFILIA